MELFYRLKRFLIGPAPRGSKHANSKKVKRLANLVRLQKKAARKRAYASRRVNSKRAKGAN